MAPLTTNLVAFFLCLALTPASMAGPIPSRTMPTPSNLVLVTSSASASDVPPDPVFTLGPGGLPPVSAPTTTNAQSTASVTAPVLEMDWLS
ncbi:hypothetical protein BD309DRAFT_586798 [Dichomitus squalens]|nr:hypothetical protein BD309DRAFT_586798 [Dichomitus squalens]